MKKKTIDNYFWSPIKFSVQKRKPAKSWKPIKFFDFEYYMKHVDEWYLEIIVLMSQIKTIFGGVSSGSSIVKTTSVVTSHSGHTIAGTFRSETMFSTGTIHMIPPLKDSKESIKLILQKFGVSFIPITQPEWVEKISTITADKIQNKINLEYKKIKKIKENISDLELQRQEIIKYKKLLYADGYELEEIVKDSFKLIGISSIRKGRDANHEDLIFDLKSKKYDICPVEVKGLEGNMKIGHVRQSLNWAWDYKEKGKKSKPLIVVNAYRNEDITKSKSKRSSFRDFEEECRNHDICILPTIVLFDVVQKKLSKKSFSVKKFEDLIMKTKGTMKL